jgi:hypothetical protein
MHHERLSSESSDPYADDQTVASSLPTVIQQIENEFIQPDPVIILETVSETSYAETGLHENVLIVPKLPEAAEDGALFECPFCFTIVSGIRNRNQWKYVPFLPHNTHFS